MTGIKNNYEETADVLAVGLVCLCRSYRGINVQLSFITSYKIHVLPLSEFKCFISVVFCAAFQYLVVFLSHW